MPYRRSEFDTESIEARNTWSSMPAIPAADSCSVIASEVARSRLRIPPATHTAMPAARRTWKHKGGGKPPRSSPGRLPIPSRLHCLDHLSRCSVNSGGKFSATKGVIPRGLVEYHAPSWSNRLRVLKWAPTAVERLAPLSPPDVAVAQRSSLPNSPPKPTQQQ